MFVALDRLIRISFVFLLASPSLSQAKEDRSIVCEEMWAKAVFFDESKLNWKEGGLVPEASYVIEENGSEAHLKLVGKPMPLGPWSCRKFLGGDIRCANDQFSYDSSEGTFVYHHYNGTFILMTAGRCREF